MDDLMQREFKVFAKTGFKDGEHIEENAVVCHVVLDKGDTTLTKLFHSKKKDSATAEELMTEWLFVEPNVQSSSKVDLQIFMNYSPLGTTSHSIVEGVKSLEQQGKRVRVSVKFVALHIQGEDDEDTEENREGLRTLKRNRVKLGLFDEFDWSHLLNVLRDPTWVHKAMKGTSVHKKELQGIIRDVDDIEEHTSMSKASDSIPKVHE